MTVASLVALASVVFRHLPIQIPFVPHFSQLQSFPLVARSVAGGIDSYFPFFSSFSAYYSSRILVYKAHPSIIDRSKENCYPSNPEADLSPFPSAFWIPRVSAPHLSQRGNTHTFPHRTHEVSSPQTFLRYTILSSPPRKLQLLIRSLYIQGNATSFWIYFGTWIAPKNLDSLTALYILHLLVVHNCLVTSNRVICSQPDTCTKLGGKNVPGLPNVQVTVVST